MALNLSNFREVGGPANSGNSSDGGQVYSLFSKTDTLTTMVSDGYLNPLSSRLNPRDIIFLSASDDAQTTRIDTNSGGVITTSGVGDTEITSLISANGASELILSEIAQNTKQIILMFNGLTADASGGLRITLGNSAGFITSGYNSTSLMSTTGGASVALDLTGSLGVSMTLAADALHGLMTLTLIDPLTNTWVDSHNARASTTKVVTGGGNAGALTTPLTQIRITLNTGLFNGGSLAMQIVS